MSDVQYPDANPYAAPKSHVATEGVGRSRFATGYAGFWRRFAAMMIDGMLLGVAQMAFLAAVVAAASLIQDNESLQSAVIIIGYVLSIVLYIAYFVVMESSSLRRRWASRRWA
jgi:hypothetical protein